MPRGGKRSGTPGTNYNNRSDLRTTQPIQAPSGGQYGARKALEDAQRSQPLQNASGVQNQMAAPQGQPSVFPGELGALDRPTERPDEPVTAGAPAGPGPGMEALGVDTVSDEAVARLQVIYKAHPSEGLRQLLETLAEEI